MKKTLTVKKLQEWQGHEIGLSEWMTISQDRINAFADATEDRQWIHVDVEKAGKSPLKSTVAHGFLLLSLLPHFLSTSKLYSYDVRMIINYGLNQVRFISPVKSGAGIRCRAVLKEVKRQKRKSVLLTVACTIEIEGVSKPAMAAEVLALVYL
ncbi:MAG: MaoC family dehydratase [Candidatus Aminicenantes bacterium]